MRRTFALWFVTLSLVCGCAAGLAAPAALAAGSTGTTTQPSFNLNSSAAQNALTPAKQVNTPASSSSSSSSGLSTLDGYIIAGVAMAVLIGVAVLIRTDARQHVALLRHGNREDVMFATGHSGSKAPRKTRKLTPAERKRRKRGKAR